MHRSGKKLTRGAQAAQPRRRLYLHRGHILQVVLIAARSFGLLDLCIEAFGGRRNDSLNTERLRKILGRIRANLFHIQRCSKYTGLDPQFMLSTTTDNIDNYDDAVTLQRVINDDSEYAVDWSESKWRDLRRTNFVLMNQRFMELVIDLDDEVRKLCHLTTSNTRAQASLEPDSMSFATVNGIMCDKQTEYLKSRIQYSGAYSPKKGGLAAGKRERIRGVFLVSLKEFEQRNNMQFRSWVDFNCYLQRVISNYVLEK